jgi:hypothetical protein
VGSCYGGIDGGVDTGHFLLRHQIFFAGLNIQCRLFSVS